MSSWRLKQSLLTGANSMNSKSALFIVMLAAISLFCYLNVSDSEKAPEAKLKWLQSRSINKFSSEISEDVVDPGTQANIAIVMIVTNDTKPEFYAAAIKSVECYSKIHNYKFILAVDADFECPHKDKFFRRHCAVAKILPQYDAILYLDADIGVVNPKRRIEEFMKPGIDVTFYDRFYNWEIASGSYIARNTQFALRLLNDFADYEYKLPNSVHGTDNGALHILLAERLFPLMTPEIDICRQVYKKSANYDDLFTYEACIRAIMGAGTDFGKVRILHKGTGWVRDGWLSSMLWHPDIDFMFHGWKTNQLRETPLDKLKPEQMGRSHWYNPLLGQIDLSKCHPGNSTWTYDSRLQGNKEEILESLHKFREQVAVDQVHSYSRMTEMLKRGSK